MGWRQIISRVAEGGSLERFSAGSWRLGTGAPKTTSKIKASNFPRLKKTATRSRTKGNSSILASVRGAVAVHRFALHVVVIGVAGAIVVSSQQPSSQASAVASLLAVHAPTTSSAVLDQTSSAMVAADVATKTSLTVAHEATQTASNLSSQVSLPTAGDDALAKRYVVATAGAASRGISSYVVGSGDTLSQIAAKFNVTSDTIRWANNLDNVDALAPGQSLTILPVTGVVYTVGANDTAESIASRFQANAAQIVSYNNAEVKPLAAGQKIVVPDGVIPDVPKPVVRAAVASAPRAVSAPALTAHAFSGNGYAYGYCTFYVASRRAVPSSWGNASSWYYSAQASGFRVGSAPIPGAIAWTSAGYYGHVAYVEQVSGGQVLVSEMNYAGNWNRVTSRWVSASAFRYIY